MAGPKRPLISRSSLGFVHQFKAMFNIASSLLVHNGYQFKTNIFKPADDVAAP